MSRIPGQDVDTATGDISEYEGPAQNFPFKAIRLLGTGQLILALLLEMLVIVQLALSYEDRYVFLASASVGAWTPIPAVAAGIVGIAICQERYWETQCLKAAFYVLTALNGFLFMPILVLVTAIVTSAYYDVTDPIKEDHLLPIISKLDDDDKKDTRKFLVAVVITLGLLQVLVCIVSLLATCCCAPLYELKGAAMQRRLHSAHSPKPVKGNQTYDRPRSVTRLTIKKPPPPRYTTSPDPIRGVAPAPTRGIAANTRPMSGIGFAPSLGPSIGVMPTANPTYDYVFPPVVLAPAPMPEPLIFSPAPASSIFVVD